jgi:hypothetical protein
MIEKERAQELFEAVRLHLSSNYDFFKYNGKLGKRMPKKITHAASYIVTKIADEDHLIYYLIANQIHYYFEHGRFCSFFPDIVNDTGLENYKKFLNSLKSLEVNLYSEFETLKAKDEIKRLADINDVVTMFYQKQLSLFTILHLLKFAHLLRKKWKSTDDPLANDFINFLERIEPFLKFREEIFSNIIRSVRNS